ncbi:MAG TPA: hypothetical protein VFN05_17810 [Actinomycetes bacterium]|nr:hypothetical protein [Actinomycetes bacterium]
MSAPRTPPLPGSGRAGGHGTAWVAGTVRARSLAGRRLGAGAARGLAASASLEDATAALAATPYRHGVRAGQDLAGAQRGVTLTLLWHLRVLAGWVPREGGRMLRLLAGWFEIANVDDLLQQMAGRQAEEPLPLGALATAWPRCAHARSPAELRATLAASPWGDPGGEAAWEVQLGMRLSWTARLSRLARVAPWASGAAALLVARERFVAGRELSATLHGQATRLLGRDALAATSLAELGQRLPSRAGWPLTGVEDPVDLWRAEAGWWSRVERDGLELLAAARVGAAPVLGAVAVLGADAQRVRAALEVAARGGQPLEVLDALA